MTLVIVAYFFGQPCICTKPKQTGD